MPETVLDAVGLAGGERALDGRERADGGESVVDIGAELYAIASAVTYANTIKTERPDLGEQAFELADLFCKQARGRVDRLFDELWSNNDDANYAAAQSVLEGRFTWVEEGIADPSGDGPMIAEQPEAVRDTGEQQESRAATAEASHGAPPVGAKVQ